MPNLIKPADGPIHVSDKLRAKTIYIDNFSGPASAQIVVEPEMAELDQNGEFITCPKRGHKGTDLPAFTFSMQDVGTDMFKFTDPVTGETHTVSGYGLAQGVAHVVIPQLLKSQPPEVQEKIQTVE